MFAFHRITEGGPNTSLSWLLWLALGFFFLIVIIGWLVGRREQASPPTEVERETRKGHGE